MSAILWAFIILFIILGLGYSTLTPIFENSDETLHYPYVKHLADGQGLPLAIPNQLWNQEGTQPPLYYAIVAATTFWIDTDNLLDHLQPNPHWRFTDVRALINDNQNAVLHGPMDAFPYHRAALAIHIGRWWSLLFGLVTVVCTFLIAQHLFPNNLSLTISTTTLTAFTPQFIRVSATVSNDSLSAALASFAVLLALKLSKSANAPKIRGISPHTSAPLLLGLLAGLALLTKLSSLSVFFLVAFIIFWRLFFITELHQRPFQTLIRRLLIIGGITVILNGWWFVRNYQLYGEWLAIETHLNLAERGNLILSDIWSLRTEVERAYWVTLGWGQIRPPEWVYQLLGWFTRLGLVGLGLGVFVKLLQGDRPKPITFNLKLINIETIIFLIFWAGLNLILYLRWVMAVGSVSHTRLIFPAITAISLLLALGWHIFLPRRLEIWFAGLLTAGLLTLNLYNLGWLIYPAFNPNLSIAQPISNLSPPDNILNVTFLNSLKLTGGQIYPLHSVSANLYQPTTSQNDTHLVPKLEFGNEMGPTASQGDIVIIKTHWQTLKSMDKNYSVAATLLAPDGSVLAQRETYPGLGLRPTRYLNLGDTFADSYPLELTNQISKPVVAKAIVTLFNFHSASRTGFPALDAQGNEITPIIGQLKIVPKTWPSYNPAYPTSVNFANTISLIGYDLLEAEEKENSSDLSKDSSPKLILYWEALATIDEDYNLFIHLLDAQGNIVAQADAPPTNNTYPTQWWAFGEIIADSHLLPNTPAATHLRLGLYSLISGQRLPITESMLPYQDNGIEIELP